MLDRHPIVGFIPTSDAARARAFYVDRLGLPFLSEDAFALVVSAHGNSIRIVRMGAFTPAPYTILGWEVPDLTAAVEELTAAGIAFLRFSFFTQDPAGIWSAPDGSRVAWFHDPDGNTLSLSQHPAP